MWRMPGTEPSCESWTSTEICSTAPRGWVDGVLGAWDRSVGGEGMLNCCGELEKERDLEGKGGFDVAATIAVFFTGLVRVVER